MNSTLNAIVVFFIVIPLLLVSYQIGTQSAATANITDYLNQPAIKTPLASALRAEAEKPKLPERKPEAQDLEIGSMSALVWDFKNDFYFFSKNMDEVRPIASLTKLVTAAVVLDKVSPDETTSVSRTAIQQEGNQGNLHEGETLTVRDLLAAALLESSNDAAYTLAEFTGTKIIANPDYPATPVRAFVRAMNEKFNELGLVNSNFTEPTGLDDAKSFSTARDFSKFIKYLRSNSNYREIWNLLGQPQYKTLAPNGSVLHEFKSTNSFFTEFSNIVGGKTGYTDAAMGNMLLVLTGPNETEIIYLVLGSKDRFGDIRDLVNWTGSSWTWPAKNK